MLEYIRLTKLAKCYDMHPDTLRKKLKNLHLTVDEHFIMIDSIIRFNPKAIHPLLTNQDDNKVAQDILNRFLI